MFLLVFSLYLIYFFSLNYLDKQIKSADPSSLTEDWQPWVLYRSSLMHGDVEPGPLTSWCLYKHKNKKGICKLIFKLYYRTIILFNIFVFIQINFLDDDEDEESD